MPHAKKPSFSPAHRQGPPAAAGAAVAASSKPVKLRAGHHVIALTDGAHASVPADTLGVRLVQTADGLRAQLVSANPQSQGKAGVKVIGKAGLKRPAPPKRGTLAGNRLAKVKLAKGMGESKGTLFQNLSVQVLGDQPASSRLSDERLVGLTKGDPMAKLLDVVRRRFPVSASDEKALRGDLAQLLESPAEPQVTPPATDEGVPEGDVVLTTQEAADLVGVSRPHLVARVDEGAIPLFSMAGTQRRVLRSAVLAWKARSLEQQALARRSLADDLDEELQRDD